MSISWPSSFPTQKANEEQLRQSLQKLLQAQDAWGTQDGALGLHSEIYSVEAH